LFGLGWSASFAVASVITMSSTAMLSKLLVDRMELESPHGRQVIGVLLFQDLAVVPLLILIPALAQPADVLLPTLGVAALKAVLVLTLILFIGQRLMRRWFLLVARRKSSELFMLNILFTTLGLAWVTELAGLSLALGAFLAGMLISETEYRIQVEEDIKPFRDVLLGLFMITVGFGLVYLLVSRQREGDRLSSEERLRVSQEIAAETPHEVGRVSPLGTERHLGCKAELLPWGGLDDTHLHTLLGGGITRSPEQETRENEA